MTSSPQTKRRGRPTVIIDGHKKCPRCNIVKPLNEFRKRGTYLHSFCNPCKTKYMKKRRQEQDPVLQKKAAAANRRYLRLYRETKGTMTFENVGVPMRIYP